MGAEWKDVFISSQHVIDWQILDIGRVVKLALPFDVDQVRIVLSDARQTAFAGIHGVAPPVGVPKIAVVHAD